MASGMKKAVIVVRLISEGGSISNSQIVREILAEAEIPWAKNIVKVITGTEI